MPEPPNRRIAASDRDIYSVSRLNREVRMLLEQGLPAVWIEAEISNLSRPASGHWYFSLKDRDAQVRCAMFRQKNLAVRFALKEGQLVLARARVSLYEPRGDFQLIVEHLEEAGIGALRREFDRLKERLLAEGLFDPQRKRPLPPLPRRIGVVTSPSGAAIRDILHVLQRRFPAVPVVIYPTAVQGASAVPEILAALQLAASRAECEVLIVARGGGSLEDLWAFNDERVARALAAMPMPVVSGVGHEVDFTIADFVADVRAPTPTGAAELVVPDRRAWIADLVRVAQRLAQGVARQLRDERERHARLARRLALMQPGQRVSQGVQRLDELEQRLGTAQRLLISVRAGRLSELAARLAHGAPSQRLQQLSLRAATLDGRLRARLGSLLQDIAQRLAVAQRGLHTASPLATLARGYAIVTRVADGRIVTDAASLAIDEQIDARLGRGRVRARILGRTT